MKPKQQQGFAHLMVLAIIVLVLAAISGAGYYVWYQNSHRQSARSPQSTAKTQAITTYDGCLKAKGSKLLEVYPQICVTQDGKHFTQPVTQNYLTIKEWGVRLKLTNDNASLYYYISPKLSNVVYLSLKTVVDSAPACAADKFSLASISRQTMADYRSSEEGPGTASQTAILLGDYYYVYQPSPVDCTAGNSDAQAALDQAQSSVTLTDTFKTLEPAPPAD